MVEVLFEVFFLSYLFVPKLVPREGKVNKDSNASKGFFFYNLKGEAHALSVPLKTNIFGLRRATQILNITNLIPNHQHEVQGPNQLVQTMSLLSAVLSTEGLATPAGK